MISDINIKDVKYLVDKKGRKPHALLTIKALEELLEDLEDLKGLEVVRERRNEGVISIEEMKKRPYGSEEVPG